MRLKSVAFSVPPERNYPGPTKLRKLTLNLDQLMRAGQDQLAALMQIGQTPTCRSFYLGYLQAVVAGPLGCC